MIHDATDSDQDETTEPGSSSHEDLGGYGRSALDPPTDVFGGDEETETLVDDRSTAEADETEPLQEASAPLSWRRIAGSDSETAPYGPLESTSAAVPPTSLATDPLSAEPPPPEPAHPVGSGAGQLGRFILIDRLGKGGMGIVYDALDPERGCRVALKILARLDAASLSRFKREFRARADLNHPNLVPLFELFSEADQWFFTMEKVEGTDFLSYVRPHGEDGRRRLDPARLRERSASSAWA